MAKYAATISPAPDGLVYACRALAGDRVAGVMERDGEFAILGTEESSGTAEIGAVPIGDAGRNDALRRAIRWSCRWSGRADHRNGDE